MRCAYIARQQYTPMGLFFSLTPITMKLPRMKVNMKSKKKCITSFFFNEFKYANELKTHYNVAKMHPNRHFPPLLLS